MDFTYEQICDLFQYVTDKKLDTEIAKRMMPVMYEHPKMDFDSVLVNLEFKRFSKEEIVSKIPFLKEKYKNIRLQNCLKPRRIG